jgi:hypothetical protein
LRTRRIIGEYRCIVDVVHLVFILLSTSVSHLPPVMITLVFLRIRALSYPEKDKTSILQKHILYSTNPQNKANHLLSPTETAATASQSSTPTPRTLQSPPSNTPTTSPYPTSLPPATSPANGHLSPESALSILLTKSLPLKPL